MSIKVSQDAFNEAVLENVECFSLSLEDSIKETLEQFKAQGVDVSGVITDPAFVGNDNPITKIKDEFLIVQDVAKKVNLLQELENLIKKDPAYKLYCHRCDIFNMCLDALIEVGTPPTLKNSLLDFLLVLLDGYPDMADERGCLYFLLLLDEEATYQIYGLKLLYFTSLKHENNRQIYVENNVDGKISKLVSKQPNDDVLVLICKFIMTMTVDDDVRAAIPKAYTHACKFADALLKPFCRFLKVRKDPTTLRYLLKAMTSIVVNYEYCADVEEEGGVPAVMFILEKQRDNEPLVTQCFKFLTCLAGNDIVKDKLMKFDVAEEIRFSLNQHIHAKKNVNAALTLISKISLRSPEYGKLFFKLDLPPLIVQALQMHTDDYLIQASGCWCVRNMSARNPEYHNQFVSLGIEDILNRILKTNKCCSYDAKIALQELGLPVVAREPWTGKEGDKLAHTHN